jgi:hypothetical protein
MIKAYLIELIAAGWFVLDGWAANHFSVNSVVIIILYLLPIAAFVYGLYLWVKAVKGNVAQVKKGVRKQ